MPPLISVCIPAYNRPAPLYDLLESVAEQNFNDYEIVISEDCSPRAEEIVDVVAKFIKNYEGTTIRLSQNLENLGYDGNFRRLIEISEGKYCVFMGDDDLLVQGALSKIASVVRENEGIGVVLRTWGRMTGDSRQVHEEFRYFNSDRVFEPSDKSVVALFRRSVAISGYTVKRSLAQEYSTDRFDGTLLYQLYLTGMILAKSKGYYISQLISLMRVDSDSTTSHFFGSSVSEQEKFKPGVLEASHSLNFIKGMIEIAEYLEANTCRAGLAKKILRDMGNYSYPLLSYQVDKPPRVFARYYLSLLKLGLWKNVYIHLYFVGLLTLGRTRCENIIVSIKSVLNQTPKLGRIYGGEVVE